MAESLKTKMKNNFIIKFWKDLKKNVFLVFNFFSKNREKIPFLNLDKKRLAPVKVKVEERKNPRGFVSVIALLMVTLIMVVSFKVQTMVLDSIENIQNSRNFYQAQVTSDSVNEYLQSVLSNREAGFNLNLNCITNEAGVFNINEDGDPIDPECDRFAFLMERNNLDQLDIKMKIKGRPEKEERIGDCSEALTAVDTECYSIPIPGEGDAAPNCSLYEPAFPIVDPDSGATSYSPFLDLEQLGYNTEYSQRANYAGEFTHIDHACNWGKLTSGSNFTDRVSIPMYYEGDEGEIVSPFLKFDNEGNEKSNTEGSRFALRLRAPCRPCDWYSSEAAYDEASTKGDSKGYPFRTCFYGEDEGICEDDERYALSPDLDLETVVSWQISGRCLDGDGLETSQECGLIAGESTALTGQMIIDSNMPPIPPNRTDLWGDNTNSFLSQRAVDSTSYLETGILLLSNPSVPSALDTISRPVLSLILSRDLFDQGPTGGQRYNIPYLEYQLVADTPLASPATKIEVSTNIGGNIVEKSIVKEEAETVLDFAVQN